MSDIYAGGKAKKTASPTKRPASPPSSTMLVLHNSNGHGNFEYSLNSRTNLEKKKSMQSYNKSPNVSAHININI